MATIANLDINLGARVAGFEKGMKSAQGAIGKLQKSAGGAGGKFLGMAKGVAVAAATALAAKFSFDSIASAFERLDKASKSSDTLGIEVGDLQALHIAADLAGVSTETLERALFKSKMSLSQFLAVADEISAVENAQERNAMATERFGKAAVELMPLLNAGSGAFKEAQADAARFGLTISKVDGKGIELANDSLTRVGNVLNGVINKIAVEAAPLITGLAEWFLDAGDGALTFGEMITTSMEVAATAIAGAATAWQIFGAPIKFIGAGILELVSLIADAVGGLEKLAISVIGDKADLGISKVSDKVARSTEKLATSLFDNATEGFVSGITGKTFTDLMNRFDSAKQRAKDAADNAIQSRGVFDPEDDISKKAIDRPGALERGTSAAASAILKGGGGPDKMQLDATKRTNEILAAIRRDLSRGGVMVAPI